MGLDGFQVHRNRLVLAAAIIVDEGGSQNREQPALGIRARSMLLPGPVGLQHAVLDELAEEIVVRRLGLSPTVAAQIQRYRQAAERGGAVELDETVSVLRLIGRRVDAHLVFADAGRRAARYAARARGRSSRTLASI